MTATLCLLAFGAVMVYSASSPLGVLNGQGSGTGDFVRYLVFGGLGLAAMHLFERRGIALLNRQFASLLLLVSFVLLVLVLLPGFGVQVNGARRWFALGPIQFQPSELMKIALVLYVARYLAEHPKRMRGVRQAIMPIAVVAGPACLLIVVEPDLGTALVVAFTITVLLVAGGMPLRYLVLLGIVAGALVVMLALAQPYQRARLTAFLHPVGLEVDCGLPGRPGADRARLGRPVRRRAGQIGAEDLLPAGGSDRLHPRGDRRGARRARDHGRWSCLYGMIAYAGLRTARRAVGRYAKLLATGLTSLILCQGILNIFVVLGLAPLTGVPLPFISYAPTNLCVMLASVGLLLNISRPGARRLKVVEAPERDGAADRDRRRRDRRARRAGAGGRRRAAG